MARIRNGEWHRTAGKRPYQLLCIPRNEDRDSEALFEGSVNARKTLYPESVVVDSGSVDGDWIQSHYFVADKINDVYFVALQDEDFVIELSLDIPADPTDHYDDDELVPGEWSGYEFDRESAAQFLFEEHAPQVHEQFQSLMEQAK